MTACCGNPSAEKAAATKTEVKYGPEIALVMPDTVGGTECERGAGKPPLVA